MKNKNNKGFTILELVFTFAILMVVILAMLKIVVDIKTTAAEKNFTKEMNEYKSGLLKEIQDDLIKKQFTGLSGCTDANNIKSCILNFADGTGKTLLVNLNTKVIQYYGVNYPIPNANYIEFLDSHIYYYKPGESKPYEVEMKTLGNNLIINIPYFEIKLDTNRDERVNKDLDDVKYIKDCINGSSADTSNHWVEIQAIYNNVNKALNRPISGTVAENASYPYSRIVDGSTATATYAMASAVGLQCVTITLDNTYDLDEIGIWHYYGTTGTRTYYNNKTYVSTNGSTWKVVIDKMLPEETLGKHVSAYEEEKENIGISIVYPI